MRCIASLPLLLCLFDSDVMVGETLSQALELPTKYAGEHSLVVTFSSREFTNIAGSTTISVEK